jgi:hypothetical protein
MSTAPTMSPAIGSTTSSDGQLAALRPEADRLRAALLRGESPESLGLTEDGLARLLEERDIG